MKEASQRIDLYLKRLRKQLHSVNNAEVDEIVAELHSHITDRLIAEEELSEELSIAAVDRVLAELGNPETLAGQYLAEYQLVQINSHQSSIEFREFLFKFVKRVIAGLLILFTAFTGYFFAGIFILCAILKLTYSKTAGLWFYPDGVDDFTLSLRVGFYNTPTSGEELLGWWIVPIGLLLGYLLIKQTSHFLCWYVRKRNLSLKTIYI